MGEKAPNFFKSAENGNNLVFTKGLYLF